MERWGIIYCPKTGVLHSHKKWESIRNILNERGVNYDFVQSEGNGCEERLAAMLAKNGYKRLVVVGGDGALNRVINGVLKEDINYAKSIEFGLIPNGHANDYAKFWGLHQDDPESAIDSLVNGRVRKVDIGKLYFSTQEGEDVIWFMNCMNVGLVSSILDIKHKTYRFWGLSSLSYLTSMFLLIFQRLEHRMKLTVNKDTIDQSLMTVCVGNAHGYGQTPNAVPYNGMLDITTVSHPAMRQLFEGMYMLLTGRILNHKNVRPFRTRGKVSFLDIGKSKVSVDGLVVDRAKAPMEVTVSQEFINLIIPS